MKNDAPKVIAFGGNTMVYESIKRRALRELQGLIRLLLENVDDALFDLSDKVDNDRDRTMYFDAMRMMRLKRKAIEEQFKTAMQQAFDDLMLERRPREEKPAGDFELSLVDHDVVEDQVAIESMISRARPGFEDDLFALRERLRTVLHRQEIDPDQNPFDPKAICESFHDACQVLDTEIEVKLILYKLFEKFVMRSLGGFYDTMNDYFVEKGVLPELKASQERISASARRATHYRRGGGAGATGDTPLSPDTGGELAAAATDGNLLAMLQQALAPGSGVPGDGTVAGGAGASAPAGVGIAPAPGFVTALQGLQAEPIVSVPLEQVDPGEMKTQLQQQISVFREQNRHQVSAADDQVINIVSMLFDFFFDDHSLPDPIKVLIGRLQIPILKLAIIDTQFFNSKKHPARRLLDNISKASLGWSESEDQERVLVAEIERIVNILIDEYDQDVAVFERVNDEFEAFLEQERQRAAENLEQMQRDEQRHEQRLQEGRQAARALLGELLDGRDFSFDVTEFLQGTWEQVLVNTWVTEGEDSIHWKNLQRITVTLVWTLIPKDTEEQRKKLLETLPPLLRALSKGMELIHVGEEECGRVFQMLMLEHTKVIKKTSQNIVSRDRPAVEPSVADPDPGVTVPDADEAPDSQGDSEFRDESAVEALSSEDSQEVIRDLEDFTSCVQKGEIDVDEEIVLASEPEFILERQSPEIDEDLLDQVQALQVGDWLEFLQEDGQWQHARLSWKSNVTGKLVFVNRHGRKLRDTRVKRLAVEFAAGKARRLESVSVFDRAIHSIMSGLKS